MPKTVVTSTDSKLIDADKIVWISVDDSGSVTIKLVSGDTQALKFKDPKDLRRFLDQWEDN